jgi:protein-S-isoprenylcysteine O-methyltransferase Ste14
MSAQRIRYLANALITVFSILIIVSILKGSSSRYHWLWGIPGLVVAGLDIYFLTRSTFNRPKNADTRLSTFFLSVGGALGFGISALFIDFPAVSFLQISWLRDLGSVISLIPYPFIIWSLLCLKDCLTTLPEAHEVVAHGIYKYSRHPLYMCYLCWNVANIAMFPSLLMISVSILDIAVQILRLRREEELLLATFPEYRLYYKRTGLVGSIRLKFLLGE